MSSLFSVTGLFLGFSLCSKIKAVLLHGFDRYKLAQEVMSYCLLGKTSFPILLLHLFERIFSKDDCAIEFRTHIVCILI